MDRSHRTNPASARPGAAGKSRLGRRSAQRRPCDLPCGAAGDYGATLDGYPAFVVAATRAATLVLASSKVTVAVLFSKDTFAALTPSTLARLPFMMTGHDAQVMLSTLSVTI